MKRNYVTKQKPTHTRPRVTIERGQPRRPKRKHDLFKKSFFWENSVKPLGGFGV